ncbi:MAG TPA: DUF5947 family protein [Labilithrix sp.]|nr:DUF5947 family protein [Labilithrix sp.]
MDRISELVDKIEHGRPEDVREDARALVAEVLAYHREGLHRLVATLAADSVSEASRDPLIKSLFDLHEIEVRPPAALLDARRLTKRTLAAKHDDDAVCELCSAKAGPRHAHLVDVASRALLCACIACSSNFGAATKLRRVPEAVRRAVALGASDAWWATLGVPTGVAFFVPRSASAPSVFYPGLAGATEANVVPEAWQAAVSTHPLLAEIEPEVEALLVDRVDGAREHWIVGVDRCFELVFRIRQAWTGLTGGEGVRDARRAFFSELAREAS